MTEELRVTPSPRCYLCGEVGRVLFPEVRDRLFSAPGTWTLRVCGACGLIWLDPVPDPAELSKLQAGYYTHVENAEAASGTAGSPLRRALRAEVLGGRLGYAGVDRPGEARGAARILAWVPLVQEIVAGEVAYLRARPGAKLLDVGCGNGDFLARMRQLGWRVGGVEPDAAAGATANERLGGGVSVCALEDAGLEAGSVDVITMNHVIEHVPDPVATLAECRRILRPGGQIAITTPNASSLGRRRFGQSWLHWDPPRHLFLFTGRTLRQCLERAGLAAREVRTLSRAARWSWTASTAIARGRPIEGWTPTPANQNTRSALAFALAEHLVSYVAPVGEELWVLGEKRREGEHEHEHEHEHEEG